MLGAYVVCLLGGSNIALQAAGNLKNGGSQTGPANAPGIRFGASEGWSECDADAEHAPQILTDFRSVGCAKSVLLSGLLSERADGPSSSLLLLLPKGRRCRALSCGSCKVRWCCCDGRVRCQDIGPGIGSLPSFTGSAPLMLLWDAAAVVRMLVSCAG